MELTVTFTHTDIENLIKEDLKKQGLTTQTALIFSASGANSQRDTIMVTVTAKVNPIKASSGSSYFEGK
jgi:hypothetical protein